MAAVNLINKRGHGITTEVALKVAKYFVDRQINLEHDKYEIVGHAISQGFSTFKDNVLIEPEELSGTNLPFNISLGAVVYKVAREYAAEYIEESSKKGGGCYHCMSTSWEIGFDEYYIAKGSRKLADAEIITDDKTILELSPYLEMEGGEGVTPDGTPVYCIIAGNARPLGCAFTSSPASQVKGIYTHTPNRKEPKKAFGEEEIAKILEESKEATASVKELKENFNKLSKIDSQTKQHSVNKNSMKIKSIDEITSDFLKEAEASSSVKTFLKDELSKQSVDFVDKLKTETEAKEGFETKFSEASEEIKTLADEVKTLKDAAEARDKAETFKTRMTEIASVFVLNEKQKSSVEADIAELDEEGFGKWQSNFELFASKIADQKSDKNDKPDPNKKEDTDIKDLKSSTASTSDIPNSQKSDDKEPDLVSVLRTAITLRK